MSKSLQIVPCGIAEANSFVEQHHRHHKPVPGAKFALALADSAGTVRGVALVGRPTARLSDDGFTLEVVRLCTDGCQNACSALYSAAWRVTREMGYRRLITYTLPQEGGVSLRAAGWKLLGERGGGSWSRKNRPRVDMHPLQAKLGWEIVNV
jgi:hypothetical protein